eukprot:9207268-Pyramimonas_sp.AAC.1
MSSASDGSPRRLAQRSRARMGWQSCAGERTRSRDAQCRLRAMSWTRPTGRRAGTGRGPREKPRGRGEAEAERKD